ncbi:hypothetical protein MKW92_040104, partial [Papaver armeniacum]
MSSAATLSFSSISTFIKIQYFPLIPTSIFVSNHIKIMNIASSQSQSQSQPRAVVVVPSLDPVETDKIIDETFRRYHSNSNVTKRNGGNGVSIVWFRNDLRVLDNEALYRAWMSSQFVLPVYCIDPRNFLKLEVLSRFEKNLIKRGLNLVIRHGKPEDILPSIAKEFGAHT